MKPVIFLGNSLDDLRAFPPAERRRAGFQIERVQRGLSPDDWKSMSTVGPGVSEIRIRDVSGAFRVIYLASLPDAVYILHAFQKKSQQTAKADIDLARSRLKDLT